MLADVQSSTDTHDQDSEKKEKDGRGIFHRMQDNINESIGITIENNFANAGITDQQELQVWLMDLSRDTDATAEQRIMATMALIGRWNGWNGADVPQIVRRRNDNVNRRLDTVFKYVMIVVGIVITGGSIVQLLL